MQTWIPSALVGLALAASTSLGLAADITYTFDSDAQGWYAADGHGSVAWDSTNGRGGAGCLVYTIPADGTTNGTTEIDPRVDVAFDTTGYFSMEFDIMIDPGSGTDTGGTYGNLQFGARDAGWSWDIIWYGSVGGPGGAFNSWQHVKKSWTSNYGLKAYLQMQLAASGAPYSTNVIVYIDNVVVRDGTPPTQAVMYDFAWPESVTTGVSSWGNGVVVSHDTTMATNGSLQVAASYPGTTNWQEAVVQLNPFDWDPSKFTYLDFDLYLDAPTGLPSYGLMQVFQISDSWGWTWIAGPSLSEANNVGKWVHYSNIPLSSMTSSHGFIFQGGGSFTVATNFTYYIDNVTVWKPAEPPTIKALSKESSATGVKITMDNDSSQWQRDAICVPSGQTFYTWYGYTPISYSFTITNFPDAATHPGFEAHLYIVNQDTVPSGGGAWNQTYGGCDWNAADIFMFRIENGTNNDVIARVDWKTNLPSANPLTNELYHPIMVTNLPTAIGTWTLHFTDNENGYITGPGLTQTNFTLPPEAAGQFNPDTVCLNSFIQFGMFKNDGANDGHNNQASGTFSAISMDNGLYYFNETFPGPGIQGSGTLWRTSSSSAVQWVPSDTAYWLTWSTPDDGFSVQVLTGLASRSPVTLPRVTLTRGSPIPTRRVPTRWVRFRLLACLRATPLSSGS